MLAILTSGSGFRSLGFWVSSLGIGVWDLGLGVDVSLPVEQVVANI